MDPPGLTHGRHHRRRALKADPADQLALLELQRLDAKADQLRHQRASMPQLAALAAQAVSRRELDDRRRDVQIIVDDLSTEQRKVDGDVEQVKARRTRDRDRMDRGLITNPRDLERMQGELESLERRINSLEDDELEVMARLEDAQGDLDALVLQIAEVEERTVTLSGERDGRFTELDAELDEATAARGPLAARIPAALLTLYDKLRAQKGGVGAAELRARECGGCRIALDNAELRVISAAPPDEVVRCQECDRILVRTEESGLRVRDPTLT